VTLCYTYLETPVGILLAVEDASSLTRIGFERNGQPAEPPHGAQLRDEMFTHVREQFEAYFAGQSFRFELKLSPRGTEFQHRVWEALERIPYGSTKTYGEIAREIGKPDASRAVGTANGANPIPIIVPCHRVIGSNGALTGFGGGLPVKKMLLDLEAGYRFPANMTSRPQRTVGPVNSGGRGSAGRT